MKSLTLEGLRYLWTQIRNKLDKKVDKVSGKGLSANDYTTAEKNKLAGITAGAEVNAQSDWNVTDAESDAFIKNKPIIPTKTSQITNDSGFKTTDNDTWKENTKDNEGYVAKGSGQVNKVWKTDANGNPGWRDDNAKSSNLWLDIKGAVKGRVIGVTGINKMLYMEVSRPGFVFGPNKGYYHIADTFEFEDGTDMLSLVLKVDALDPGAFNGNARMNSCGGILHVYVNSWKSANGYVTCIDDNVGWEYETKLSEYLNFYIVYGGKNGNEVSPSNVGQLWCEIRNDHDSYFTYYSITVISEFSNYVYGHGNLWTIYDWIPGDEPEEFLPGT